MPYGILRFAKMKGGPAKSLEAHHERKKEQYASNPDIDTNSSCENYHIITPQKSYYYEIQSRIEKANCKVRKDSIKFVDTIVTASPEFFINRSPEDARAYFKQAVDFLAEEVGRENIFSAIVHMDERTPHMHLCFVPLTKDKRLSAKEIIGNRTKLVEWQDKFHERMSEVYPELQRGEPAVQTKRKHISVRLFKQVTKLTVQMEEIKAVIDDMNAFNLTKKREVLMKELAKWIPQVSSFDKQIKQVEKGNEDLKDTINRLKEDKKYLEDKAYLQQQERFETESAYQNLVADYNEIVDFINSIPEDLRQELFERHQELKHMNEDLGWELEM